MDKNVFLNVPFDARYEALYVALIAALTAFGVQPRTVLEIPTQKDRLDRLRDLISKCDASVHDLSRVETSGRPTRVPRFNMPFELGLTLGIHGERHSWFIFESVRHRASRSLSDVAGYDVHVHDGKPEGVLRAVAEAFGARKRHVSHADLVALWKLLRGTSRRIRKERGNLFTRAAFEDLVFAAQEAVRSRVARSATPRRSHLQRER